MLKIISTLLITSTLSCTVYGAAPAGLALSGKPSQQSQHYSTEPVPIEALENFLRSNYGSTFPENRWTSFRLPSHADSGLKPKATVMAEIEAAVREIPWIVAVAFHAFHQHQRSLMRLVDTPILNGIRAIPLETAINHYCVFTQPYFLRFQRMLMGLLNLSNEGGKVLSHNASHGVSTELGFAWLNDGNGIVPVPLMRCLQRLNIYHAPFPYGHWNNDYSRGMVFKFGILVKSPALYIHSESDPNVVKIIYECGDSDDFRTYPITMRTTSDHPVITSLLSQHIFHSNGSGDVHALIIMPNTPTEHIEFEAALLEIMIERAQKKDPIAISWLENYGTSLSSTAEELPDDDEPEAAPAGAPQSVSISPIEAAQRRIDCLYDEMIRAEQAAISQAVADQTAHQKPKRQKAPVGRKQLTKAQATEDPTDAKALKDKAAKLAAKKAEILARLNTQGRQKWGALIRVIMDMLGPHMNNLRFNIRGSHLNIHIKGEVESAGLTLVKPHGRKGGEVPAKVGQGLASQLVNLVMKLSTTSTE